MSLILDHVNGVPDDNRLENLRIVCPNCAATLETHCGRKNRLDVQPRACLRCGRDFEPRDSSHRYCSTYCGIRYLRKGVIRPGARQVERPSYEQLKAELAESSFCAVARRHGVSEGAVRKWLRAYEQAGDPPPGGDPEAAVPSAHRLRSAG